MKLPRDVGGRDLAALLATYGYEITRQTGSHLRLTASAGGGMHHLTLPNHKPLKVGTLSEALSGVPEYLEIEKHDLVRQLFDA